MHILVIEILTYRKLSKTIFSIEFTPIKYNLYSINNKLLENFTYMCCIFWLHCPSLLQDPFHHITTSRLLFQKITHYVQFLLSMYSWVQDFLMEHGQFIRGSCSFLKKIFFIDSLGFSHSLLQFHSLPRAPIFAPHSCSISIKGKFKKK